MLERTVKINRLLDIYGKLLTECQQQILDLYYHQDYSLSEIAQQRNCSRQAVLDVLQRSAVRLEEYELSLGMVKISRQREELLNRIKNQLGSGNIEAALKLLENLD